ncbi:MAG: I78 family peptidase inhibitor [Qipengyuania sp.]
MRVMIASLALAGAACATVSEGPETPREVEMPRDGECNADRVQQYLGEKATASLGATLLEWSQARSIRWIPPRSAVTMDYRLDRLNVEYDDAMVITRIHCG